MFFHAHHHSSRTHVPRVCGFAQILGQDILHGQLQWCQIKERAAVVFVFLFFIFCLFWIWVRVNSPPLEKVNEGKIFFPQIKRGKQPEKEESEIRLRLILKKKSKAAVWYEPHIDEKEKRVQTKKKRETSWTIKREDDRQAETEDYTPWFYNKVFNPYVLNGRLLERLSLSFCSPLTLHQTHKHANVNNTRPFKVTLL